MYRLLTIIAIALTFGSCAAASSTSSSAAASLAALVTFGSPVSSSSPTVSSTFGPRLQSGSYDFHRGIDIPGSTGDAILAIADGTIHRVYAEGSSAYPNGGNVVIVEHTLSESFTFQSQTIDKFYAVYLHLDGFSANAQAYLDDETQNTVSRGDQIGTMGSSGTASSVHLHLEIRLQTTCSLKYQTENPTADCAESGFDPHIHPLDLFLSSTATSGDLELTLSEDGRQLTLSFEADRPFFNLKRLEIAVFTTDAKQSVVLSEVFDFETRDGFDATSSEALDDNTLGEFTISPTSLGESADSYTLNVLLDLDDLSSAGYVEVTATTTQGVSLTQGTDI